MEDVTDSTQLAESVRGSGPKAVLLSTGSLNGSRGSWAPFPLNLKNTFPIKLPKIEHKTIQSPHPEVKDQTEIFPSNADPESVFC